MCFHIGYTAVGISENHNLTIATNVFSDFIQILTTTIFIFIKKPTIQIWSFNYPLDSDTVAISFPNHIKSLKPWHPQLILLSF